MRERSRRATIFRRLLLLGIVGFLVAVTPWVGMIFATRGSTLSVTNAPKRDVVMILGAGITEDNQPSDALQWRIERGVELYKAGKVRKLLMSGDNSIANYDEASVMKNLAVQLGVPDRDVILDYAGFRTLDSCVRLRKVFGQTKAIVVSQGFHLPRAIHLCRWAGVDVVGVEAIDGRSQKNRFASGVREVPAALRAWAEIHLLGKSAKFLGPQIDVFNPPPDALKQPLDTAILP
jgi:vancomycin permeability regulator SanA